MTKKTIIIIIISLICIFASYFFIKEQYKIDYSRYVGYWNYSTSESRYDFSVRLWEQEGEIVGSACVISIAEYDCPSYGFEGGEKEGAWNDSEANIEIVDIKDNTLDVVVIESRFGDTKDSRLKILITFIDGGGIKWEFVGHDHEDGEYNLSRSVVLKKVDDELSFLSSKFVYYDYKKELKNDYYLSYRILPDLIDGITLQSLVLTKDGQDIKELNNTSYGLLHKNLGYISADFGKSFAFTQSYGSGNPHPTQLINKATGEEIRSGFFVDVDEEGGIMLYISGIHGIDNEQLKIYDVKNEKDVDIPDFKDSKCVKEMIGGLRYCVKIDSVSNDEITLKVESHGEKIIKTYRR